MRLHEYQSKDIFANYQIPIPRGRLASTPEEAKLISEELNTSVVLKAQVLVGGRGKAGGVRLVHSADEAEEEAAKILGNRIKDIPVRRLLVEEGVNIQQEIYFGMTVDREKGETLMIASAEGGVEIEEVARETPEKIVKVGIHPMVGLRDFQARNLAAEIEIPRALWRQFISICQNLHKAYCDLDATLVEINPLVITTDNRLIALDGKIILDDNSLFRHPDLVDKRDISAEAPEEVEARKFGLSYIKLDGNIGCLVNGAGLAMATMDIIQHKGGQPANFLDIGGGASAEKVAAAMRIILADSQVKTVLINIFGGITRCDEVANGIRQILTDMDAKIPFVIRLVGTNEEQGRQILADANLDTAESLQEAAEKAVAHAQEELQ
ncbi:MAG: ADP-forming succinate--CoA ligase subunit beta [Anaerolineaceae bacterium]|jgi:succinyl-CoA synthetase beta subunit|nr:ADP-forming succinate--CoA ligase subunit beta [Anaerolineaceae bacterium]